MKRQQSKIPKLILLFAVVCAAIYYGCSKDESLVEAPKALFLSVFGDELINISYEMESFTRMHPLGEQGHILDKISSNPTLSKHKVQMSVSETGEVNFEIEMMTPEMNLPISHATLPDNLPKPHRTVVEDGTLTVYAEGDSEIYTGPTEPLRMEHLATLVKEQRDSLTKEVVNNAILGMHSEANRANLDAMLADPAGHGVIVTALDSTVSSINMPSNVAGITGFEGEAVLLVDRTRNLLLASKLYDKNGKTLMCMMYGYDEGEVPTLRIIRQEVMSKLPTGEQAMMEIVSKIQNLNITIN